VPNGDQQSLLLATTETVAGQEIVEVLGLVAGATADREAALGLLVEQARKLGADAVVGVRLDSSASGGAFFSNDQAFAYGTAVRLRRAG
jgi:uncharacterized protein YbjQ (UPF0145 family)